MRGFDSPPPRRARKMGGTLDPTEARGVGVPATTSARRPRGGALLR
jgi:hypothetical protein